MRHAQDAPHRVSRDEEFFVGRNAISGKPAVGGADLMPVMGGFGVLIGIESQAGPGEAFADARADLG
jgi:hypothetical protein